MTGDASLRPTEATEAPGSLQSLTGLLDPRILADPYPLYRQLRECDPVHWDPYLHAWVVTRYEDIVAVLRDFSAARTPTPEALEEIGLAEISPIARVMVQQMLFLDPPAHARIRGLASPAFTPQRIAVLRSHIVELVRKKLDRVATDGTLDVIGDLAEPIPYTVTAEMLGVPIEDAPQLKLWSQDFADMLGNFQHNPGRSAQVCKSLEGLTEYFRRAIQERRSFPREGLIQSFCDAVVDGDRFTDDEIIANSIITMVGGQETTTNLIANGILTLLRYPAQMRRLRQNLDLLPSAVEEMLRFEPPSQQTARLAPSDVQVGNRTIRKRQAVIAVLAAGNRDPQRFPNPDIFDILRTDNRHLSFGWAAHFCFGAAPARIEGQLAIGELLQHFSRITMDEDSLNWRTNLGLRGLTSLRVRVERAASAMA